MEMMPRKRMEHIRVEKRNAFRRMVVQTCRSPQSEGNADGRTERPAHRCDIDTARGLAAPLPVVHQFDRSAGPALRSSPLTVKKQVPPGTRLRRLSGISGLSPALAYLHTTEGAALFRPTELQRIGGKYALVTMCIGGGQGIAAVFERLH